MVLHFLFLVLNLIPNTELKKNDLSETLIKAWLNYVALIRIIL